MCQVHKMCKLPGQTSLKENLNYGVKPNETENLPQRLHLPISVIRHEDHGASCRASPIERK